MTTVPASGRYPFTNHRTVADLDGARGGFVPLQPSPTGLRILAHLRANPDRFVDAFELRDACCPKANEGAVRVQVFRLRARCGAPIASMSGPHGGYRLQVSA